MTRNVLNILKQGHILTRQMEYNIKKPDGYWGYPVADEFVLAPLNAGEVEGVMMFLNHSCEPNVGILGQIIFAAMRDIDCGEELTIDYAMFGADKEPMKCNCRSSDCRGTITGSDWQIGKLQLKYKGYFSSYIHIEDRSCGLTGSTIVKTFPKPVNRLKKKSRRKVEST